MTTTTLTNPSTALTVAVATEAEVNIVVAPGIIKVAGAIHAIHLLDLAELDDLLGQFIDNAANYSQKNDALSNSNAAVKKAMAEYAAGIEVVNRELAEQLYPKPMAA